MSQFNIVDRRSRQKPLFKAEDPKPAIVEINSQLFLDRSLSVSAKGIYGIIAASINNNLRFNPLPYMAEVKELERHGYVQLIESENGFIIRLV